MTSSNGFFIPRGGSRPRPDSTPDTGVSWQARAASEAPRIDFDKFLRTVQVERGEHFSLIGPTGGGKTNMLISLLPLHPFTVVFATKPRDETMERLIDSGGYHRMERWQGGLPAQQFPRRVLWPNARKLDSQDTQKEVFGDALNQIYTETGWTVGVDEMFFISNTLKLSRPMQVYYTQARSLDISVFAATQRPANVPTEMYDQATHLMFWRTTDRRSLDRIEEINYGNTGLIRRLVADLEKFQVLYINTRTGQMFRTRAPLHKATVGR